MLAGHLQEKGGKYYAVLNCKHQNGKRFPKWICTGYPVKKGNKRLAISKLEEFKNTYNSYGELIICSSIVNLKRRLHLYRMLKRKKICFSPIIC